MIGNIWIDYAGEGEHPSVGVGFNIICHKTGDLLQYSPSI